MSSERQARRLSYDYTLGGVPCGIRPQTLLPKKGSGRVTGGRNGSCLATPFLSDRNVVCMNARDFTSLDHVSLLCSAWNFPPQRHAMNFTCGRNNGIHHIPPSYTIVAPEIHLPVGLRTLLIKLSITYASSFTYNKQYNKHFYAKINKTKQKNSRTSE